MEFTRLWRADSYADYRFRRLKTKSEQIINQRHLPSAAQSVPLCPARRGRRDKLHLHNLNNHYHFSHMFALFHNAVGFADIFERQDSINHGVELALLDEF